MKVFSSFVLATIFASALAGIVHIPELYAQIPQSDGGLILEEQEQYFLQEDEYGLPVTEHVKVTTVTCSLPAPAPAPPPVQVWLEEPQGCDLFSGITTTTTTVATKPTPEALASTDHAVVVKAMKVDTLKAELKSFGISCCSSKAVLAERLLQALLSGKGKPNKASLAPDCAPTTADGESLPEHPHLRDQLPLAAVISTCPAASDLVSSTVGNHACGSGGLNGLEALVSGGDIGGFLPSSPQQTDRTDYPVPSVPTKRSLKVGTSDPADPTPVGQAIAHHSSTRRVHAKTDVASDQAMSQAPPLEMPMAPAEAAAPRHGKKSPLWEAFSCTGKQEGRGGQVWREVECNILPCNHFSIWECVATRDSSKRRNHLEAKHKIKWAVFKELPPDQMIHFLGSGSMVSEENVAVESEPVATTASPPDASSGAGTNAAGIGKAQSKLTVGFPAGSDKQVELSRSYARNIVAQRLQPTHKFNAHDKAFFQDLARISNAQWTFTGPAPSTVRRILAADLRKHWAVIQEVLRAINPSRPSCKTDWQDAKCKDILVLSDCLKPRYGIGWS